MAKEKTKKVEPKKEVKGMRETPKKKEAKVSRGVEPKKEIPAKVKSAKKVNPKETPNYNKEEIVKELENILKQLKKELKAKGE